MTINKVFFDNANEAREVCGVLEPLLSRMECDHEVHFMIRDLTVVIEGEEVATEKMARFIEELRKARNHSALDERSVNYAYRIFNQGDETVLEKLTHLRIEVSPRKPAIFPKTLGQKIYLNTIQNHAITFAMGPAGTGKTYLAMAMAVSALLREEVSRIILTRPAIEAGENLGFLPGDFQQKVAPYLRPLYDALHDMLPAETVESYLERGIIEVAPLAYMRGRTLNHAFVILDEAQNTTPQQMLMFLTRLGFDSKCTITGDLTQVDLPHHKASGLLEARSILAGLTGLNFIELTEHDVVRHPLVQKVIEAYQKNRSS